MTVHSRTDGDGVSACWRGCACGALEGTQVDSSIPQRLRPCQVRRLLHTSESGEKVPTRTPLRSISLVRNKQPLQETRLKALSRLS